MAITTEVVMGMLMVMKIRSDKGDFLTCGVDNDDDDREDEETSQRYREQVCA